MVALDISSAARFLLAPTTATPSPSRESATPLKRGSSGPTTASSTLQALASRATASGSEASAIAYSPPVRSTAALIPGFRFSEIQKIRASLELEARASARAASLDPPPNPSTLITRIPSSTSCRNHPPRARRGAPRG
ncbi:MAG: hypothetical protein RXP89_02575 [Nitrososphaeria archaeon]